MASFTVLLITNFAYHAAKAQAMAQQSAIIKKYFLGRSIRFFHNGKRTTPKTKGAITIAENDERSITFRPRRRTQTQNHIENFGGDPKKVFFTIAIFLWRILSLL